jgi:uncharacterized protein YbcI
LSDSPDRVVVGSVAADISNAVVHLLSEYTGRGPTRARTHIHDDLVTVVLRDTLTKGERSLVAAGKTDVVLTTRKAYQNAMKADLISAVERCSGRKVDAFLSENHIEPDIAIESFVLVPIAGDGNAGDATGNSTSVEGDSDGGAGEATEQTTNGHVDGFVG